MENVTALLDSANNNSAIINAFATIVMALATIGLWRVTRGLRRSAEASASYAEKQNITMNKQILFEIYRQLRREMDELIVPLYIQAQKYTEKDPDYFTNFTEFYTAKENSSDEVKANFWKKIRYISHFTQSEKLFKYLQIHFDCNLTLIHTSGSNTEKREEILSKIKSNAPELVKTIKERHSELKRELEEIEKELGMRKHD
jgi:hypothetical protein